MSAIVSETLSAIDRNPRPPSIGIGVRNASEYALGHDPKRTKQLANLIRAGIEVVEGTGANSTTDDIFAEGKVVTETHVRRERDPKLRKRLLELSGMCQGK